MTQKKQVYMLTFPNGKVYVGCTSDVNKRWAHNGIGYKGQNVYKAIEKFGWDNIKKDVVFQLPESETDTEWLCTDIEDKLIRAYENRSYNEKGTLRFIKRTSEIKKDSCREYKRILIPIFGVSRTRDELISQFGRERYTKAYNWLKRYDITIDQAFTLPVPPDGRKYKTIDYWRGMGYDIRELTTEERRVIRNSRQTPGYVWDIAAARNNA